MNDKTNKQDIPVIETKTFINGLDSMNVSDADVFKIIQNTENSIKELQHIKAKSSKVSDKIESLERAVFQLVQFVDNR